ncbi:YdbL family protein [Aliiglaciecola sp. LCG003]|uniref:YdbL family protein n=1 Tax=Aliiglaciecola sp. LCG003 TaxID=3053655 RepID=UPI002573C294|nr:YdbL family protein [Aliiglaciecola sp. LCG003]WJG10686.1 YdbL family protein [Aliiglaciecola sp. LCG003]
MKIKVLIQAIVMASLLFSHSVLAVELSSAKQGGLVGEQDNGYLGVVVERPDILALVNDINEKRKAKYEELARDNNITVAQVEKLAAKKAFEKTESGHYVKVDGKWLKK